MSAYPATALVGHRLNAFRLNYLDGRIYITIGGVAGQVLVDSLQISDRLNEVPNTLIATVRGAAPVEGAVIRVTLGSQSGALLFAGNILRVTRVWAAENPAHVLHHLEAIDPTWRLGATLFSARYQNLSASVIAADLLTRAPAGFTPAIEAGLPVVDEISFTNASIVDALVQLAARIGGYTLCDYDGRVYLFTTPDTARDPRALTADHPSVAGVSYGRDLSQVVTRAVVEGGGGTARAPVAPGATMLPVDVIGWYSPTGGTVRSGPQRIAYTGTAAGGAGAFVGEGTIPTAAPAAVVGLGASALEAGTHSYAYSWVTSNGETVPGPWVSVLLGPGATAVPAVGPNVQNLHEVSGSGLNVGETYRYTMAWSFHPTDPNAVSAVSGLGPLTTWLCTVDPAHGAPFWPYWYHNTFPGPLDPLATFQHWYRWLPSRSAWALVGSLPVAQIAAPSPPYIKSGQTEAAIIAAPATYPWHPAPPGGNVVRSQVAVSAVAPGPSGVTARKVYRTAADSGVFRYLATLNDNVATALPGFDNVPDAGLGAVAPTVDTAGLIQTTKLVPAGRTSIRVTSAAPFATTGGYALVGAQLVRYTGVAGTDLIGVPASGDGALVQSVPWGTPITAAPALLGVSGVVWPILPGDPVNVVAIEDDPAAQAALAAKIGGDGIRESLLQDGRISLREASARGRALLARQGTIRETFAHRARDINTRSGAVVTVDLPAPTDIHGSFRLQEVTVATFNPRGLVPPTFTASSSSQRVTFEDLVRQIANTTPAPATGEDR